MMFDQINEIDMQVGQLIASKMKEVTPEDLGLDRRAGCRLYASEDAVAVLKSQDNSLQYYGGFEYVNKEFRKEMGSWVFYFADDDERVQSHLDHFFATES